MCVSVVPVIETTKFPSHSPIIKLSRCLITVESCMYVCDCAGGRENDVTVSWGMKEFIWLTHGNHGGW